MRLFILAILLAILPAAAQPVFNIRNGRLQNALDANRQYITNIGGLFDTSGNPIVGGSGTNGITYTNNNGSVGVIFGNFIGTNTQHLLGTNDWRLGTNAYDAIVRSAISSEGARSTNHTDAQVAAEAAARASADANITYNITNNVYSPSYTDTTNIVQTALNSFDMLTVSDDGTNYTLNIDQPMKVETNMSIQAVVIPQFADVSQATGRDAPGGPYKTIGYALSNRLSTQAVRLLDGAFAESVYVTNNTSFHLLPNVSWNGSGAFWVRITNSNVSVDLWGPQARMTNGYFAHIGATNTAISVTVARVNGQTTAGTCQYDTGTSNTTVIRCDIFDGRVCSYTDPTYTNRIASTYIYCNQWFKGVGAGATAGQTNTVCEITAPYYIGAYNGGGGLFNYHQKTVYNGGTFTRNGIATTTMGSNIWFKGVSCVSSNTDASANMFTYIHGRFNFEQEATSINNP